MWEAKRIHFSVSSPQEACRGIAILRKKHGEEFPRPVTDEFGMECLAGNGWQEWQYEKCRDIEAWCEASGHSTCGEDEEKHRGG